MSSKAAKRTSSRPRQNERATLRPVEGGARAKSGQTVRPSSQSSAQNQPAARKTTPPAAKTRLPPGSLHAEARTPAQADALKAKLIELMQATQKLRTLKKSMNKNFFEVGTILSGIRERKLFEVKGYGSVESFVEREVELSPKQALDAIRIVETFLPEAAASLGFVRLSAALAAIDALEPATGTVALDRQKSPIPPHKQ